jgi:hypothetical protein
MVNYIEIRTNDPITQEYDKYIEKLYSRNAKPWKISKDAGVVFVNGDKKIYYKWSDVRDDVKRWKILKRTYFNTTLTLDEQIWQSFKSIGTDIWDIPENKETYGIHTADDHYLDWDSFKNLVENGQYEETAERIDFVSKYEDSGNDTPESKESAVSQEPDWYESI